MREELLLANIRSRQALAKSLLEKFEKFSENFDWDMGLNSHNWERQVFLSCEIRNELRQLAE